MDTVKQEPPKQVEENGVSKLGTQFPFTFEIEHVVKEEENDDFENGADETNMDVDFTEFREFHVLDEIDSNANEDDAKGNKDSDSSSYGDASDVEFIDDDELEAMLEEGMFG